MKCFRCGNELATGDAPNSLLCRTCETLLNVTLAPVPQPKTDRSRITELEAELARLRGTVKAERRRIEAYQSEVVELRERLDDATWIPGDPKSAGFYQVFRPEYVPYVDTAYFNGYAFGWYSSGYDHNERDWIQGVTHHRAVQAGPPESEGA